MHSNHFCLIKFWPFTSLFQHFQHFTKHGQLVPSNQNISHLLLPLRQCIQRLMNTTTRQLIPLHSSWPWVSACSHQQHLLTQLLVLNPKEKLSYFKKHWLLELQEVMTCAEEVVGQICLSFCHFHCWFILLSLRSDICSWITVQKSMSWWIQRSEKGCMFCCMSSVMTRTQLLRQLLIWLKIRASLGCGTSVHTLMFLSKSQRVGLQLSGGE